MKKITMIAIISLLAIALPLSAASHNFSAVFAFGDSTLDSGNNNRLSTVVRADHPPYGRDFPNSIATGRFSNGRLIPDYLVSYLGLKEFLPPYSISSSLNTSDLATGVCFASAGTGLDDSTAALTGVDTIATQLSEFSAYQSKLRGLIGDASADQVIKNALFVSSIGSNDMMLNYYIPFSPRKLEYIDVSGYHDLLLQRLEFLIKEIYAQGGRKFAECGLPPVGCVPFQMSSDSINLTDGHFGRRFCVESMNEDSIAYNNKLQVLLANLQSSLQGAKLEYVDIYNPLLDMMQNPGNYGFTEATKGCCGTGLVELAGMCSFPAPICDNPSEYIFWDAVHPSQAAYEKLAEILINRVIPQLTN